MGSYRMTVTSSAGVGFRELLLHREIRGVLLAQATSDIGDNFTRVAVATLVLVRADSALLSALTFAIAFVPPLFGTPLLTPFADRLSRKSVMLLCDLARAGIVAVLTVAAWLEAPLAALFGLLVLSEIFGVPFRAARQAMLPDILPDQQRFLAVQGLSQTLNQTNQVIGLVSGGLLTSLTHPVLALSIDALSFLVSGLLVATHVVRRSAPLPGKIGASTLVSDMGQAVRMIFSEPVRRAFVPFAWGIAYVLVAPEAVALLYAQQQGSRGLSGFLLASVPAGAAIGAVIVTRRSPARALDHMRLTAILAAIPLVLTGLNPPLPVTLALWVLAGLAQGFFVPTMFMTVTLATPMEYRGRVIGFASSIFSVMTVVGYVSTGALADLWSPAAAVASAGVFGVLVAAGLIAAWPGDALRRLVDQGTPARA